MTLCVYTRPLVYTATVMRFLRDHMATLPISPYVKFHFEILYIPFVSDGVSLFILFLDLCIFYVHVKQLNNTYI